MKFWKQKRSLLRSTAVALAAISLLGGEVPALAEATLPETEVSPQMLGIQKLDADIIKQTCELFKTNTAFRSEFGKYPKGTRLRLKVVQTINYSCTCAGLMVNMLYNLYFSKHGGKAPVATQLSATTPRFIGKALYVGDLLIEIPLEALEHRREVAMGVDPETTFRHVLQVKGTLDGLLQKRQALLEESASALPPEQYKLAKIEGRLLSEGSTLAADEYCMLYARAKSNSLRNRVWNGMTFVKKGDATFGADMTRMIAAVTDNKYLNGPASISTTFSGAMSCFGPEVYMGSQKISYNRNFKRVTNALQVKGVEDLNTFDTDRKLFQVAALNAPGANPILTHVLDVHGQIYDSMGGMVESLRWQREKELHHQKRHDWHSIAYHTAYGGSKMSRGAWLVYVGFAFLHAKGRKEKQRVSLINGYAGIDNFSGSAYREIDFVTTDIMQFLHRKRDSINRRADDALVRSRWDMLDTMEQDANVGVAELSGKILR